MTKIKMAPFSGKNALGFLSVDSCNLRIKYTHIFTATYICISLALSVVVGEVKRPRGVSLSSKSKSPRNRLFYFLVSLFYYLLRGS